MKTHFPSTTTNKKQFPFYKGVVITALLILFSSISASATHYRYGNIQWTDNGGNQVTFKIQQAWRWSYFGNPAVGSTVDIAAADGDVLFEFGDGQSVPIQIKVTSINASEDWFFGEVTYVHTYASAGNYTASFQGCCRISSLQNDHDGDFRLHTLVNVGSGAHSTVSTVVPIVDLPVNNASASFTIPVVDPDGHTVSFRLATANEAAGTGNPYVQPTGLSVNASSGLVTFSTVGKTVGNLYTSQIVISNGVTEIAVDFIIRIVPNPPPSTPPYFVYPPTPDNGHTFNVNVGDPLSFNVKAQDDDPGSSVTLTVVGMPPGATTTPALPTTGQPVTTQFNWTPTISNVGSYILVFTATDNTGISVTTQVNIKVSAVCDPDFSSTITVSPSPTIPGGDPNTIYVGNGPQSVMLTASATGGNGGNTYDWGSAGTGASITVSPSITTTYMVTVTDAGGCTTQSSVTIYVVNAPPLSCSVQKVSDVKCKGENNGSATVTPDGGIGGYTYLWDDNETTATATMLNAGSHSVTVTDSKNTTSTCNVTISEPDVALSCSTEKVSDVKCKGESNGSATVTPTGGNGGYTYLWDDNETTATATMLNAGSHSVTVTDSKGCTSMCNVTISEPDAALSCSTEKVSDVKCKGESNGSATVTPAGGNGGYTYLWDDNETTATATMLNAGSHSVTVTDAKGCTSMCNVTISEPDAVLSCSVEKLSDADCNANSTGSAKVTATGGNGGYTYLWDDNEITATATMLSAGHHSVTVTDSKGCTTNCSVDINEPGGLSCSVQKVSDVKCKGESNGSATVTPTGGNGGYTYLWDDNETTATATMLNAGSHSVTVTDSKGCTSMCNVTISEPDVVLSCSVQKVLDVKCKGESNGSATVTPTGGNGGYTYLWDDNETTATATMLNAGSHSVTVTDSKGCTSICNVTISEPVAALSCSVQKVSDVKCKGENNGSATVTPTGGNGGYTYLWDDNETTATATMLNAGSHSVTITDSKGCTSMCNIIISEPVAALSCSVQKVSDVKCKGENNGSATVTPTGGNGGYTYLWDDNETAATATMLNAGSHTVTITDAKGCTSNCSVTIYEPSAGLSIICKKTDVSCNGGTTGAIDVTVSGGTGPYTYDWSDLSGTDNPEDRTGLTTGTYSVVVTDAHGCTTHCESTISQPGQITTSTTVVNATCNKNNGSINLTVSGGSQPYTYLWSNGATTEDVQGLAEGMYSVTVTDAHNCTATASAQVSTTQPPICSITKPTPLTCNSAGNKLCATVTGGTGNIQYKWKSNNTAWVITSGQGTKCITYTAGSSSAPGATFTLTVTDANGCKSTCTVKVSCACSFVVNGVAKKTTGQCYKLTGTTFHTAGSVFSTAPVNLKKSFQVNASLYFGVNNSGGDGIAFILQNEGPHYIGNYGAGIGYNRFDGSASCMPTDNPGPVPSFIVEFDTYQNGVIDCKNVGDPVGDHIAFMSHSNSYHTSTHALSAPVEFPVNIEDGQYHDALFDWNATTHTMTVTFSVSTSVVKTYTYTGDIVNTLFKGNAYVYFGFTASNGSVTPNEHRVCLRTSCAPDYYVPQSSFATSGTSTTITDKTLTQENIVSVFPNPFNSHLSFNFKSPQNGKASLELFDMVGKKLAVIYDGELKAQAPYAFDYTVPAAYRVPMMYKLTIGDKVYHGFLMPEK